MLVLSRRIGERIVIDENVTVTVVGHQGNHIKLGIEAPRSVPVRRHELPARDFRARTKKKASQYRRYKLAPR